MTRARTSTRAQPGASRALSRQGTVRIAEIAESVRSGRASAAEVLDEHLARLEARNGELNAVVILDEERARAAAAGSRARAARGRAVHRQGGDRRRGAARSRGVAAPATRGRRADASAVARLRAAGAILIGKTNISELCAHPDSSNLVYGATRNPCDTSRSAGGSSGGEGAAVASGMSAFGIGSDYGGSVRAPASFCGVAGMRPGLGFAPSDGHLPHRSRTSVSSSPRSARSRPGSPTSSSCSR